MQPNCGHDHPCVVRGSELEDSSLHSVEDQQLVAYGVDRCGLLERPFLLSQSSKDEEEVTVVVVREHPAASAVEHAVRLVVPGYDIRQCGRPTDGDLLPGIRILHVADRILKTKSAQHILARMVEPSYHFMALSGSLGDSDKYEPLTIDVEVGKLRRNEEAHPVQLLFRGNSTPEDVQGTHDDPWSSYEPLKLTACVELEQSVEHVPGFHVEPAGLVNHELHRSILEIGADDALNCRGRSSDDPLQLKRSRVKNHDSGVGRVCYIQLARVGDKDAFGLLQLILYPVVVEAADGPQDIPLCVHTDNAGSAGIDQVNDVVRAHEEVLYIGQGACAQLIEVDLPGADVGLGSRDCFPPEVICVALVWHYGSRSAGHQRYNNAQGDAEQE